MTAMLSWNHPAHHGRNGCTSTSEDIDTSSFELKRPASSHPSSSGAFYLALFIANAKHRFYITSKNHSIFMAGFEMQPDTIKKSWVSSSVPSLIDTKVDELLLFPNRPKQVVPSMTYIDNTKISPRTMNIRDMLDEGDGIEDDINAKRRNQQWKTILEPANKRRKLHESHQHKFITAERLKLRLPQKEEVAGSKVI